MNARERAQEAQEAQEAYEVRAADGYRRNVEAICRDLARSGAAMARRAARLARRGEQSDREQWRQAFMAVLRALLECCDDMGDLEDQAGVAPTRVIVPPEVWAERVAKGETDWTTQRADRWMAFETERETEREADRGNA